MKKHLCLWLVTALLLSGCGRLVYITPEPMVHITYRAVDGEPLTPAELKRCAAIMDYRLTAIAIPDYKISPDPATGTLLVDVPAPHYSGNLMTRADDWGMTGELSICIDEDGGDPPIPPEGVVLDNRHIASAEAVRSFDDWVVDLTLTEEGTATLSDVTQQLTPVHGTLPVWMDWQVISTARIEAPLTDGKLRINAFSYAESAELFAAQINGGILPRAITASVDFSDVEE